MLLAAGELGLQIVDHGGEVRDLRRLAVRAALGAAQGRRIAEIELAVIQIRHAGQALTEGVHANDIGVHLTDAHRQGVDLFLQDALDVLDLRLSDAAVRPTSYPADRWDCAAVPRTQAHADGERRAHDAEHQQRRSRHDHGMVQVKLFHSARLAADKNDIHTDYSSNAVIDASNRCIMSYGRFEIMPRAVRVDYAEN